MSVEIETAHSEPQNQVGCSKMLEYLKRNRNQVNPEPVELPDCDFINVGPRRTLRVLRPELKSGRFYEFQTSNNRPESLNDNFYLRWAKRPHPSGNCRCSFRQSTNSNRLSSYEEKIISQEIQRIRTSLCEAEKSGKDIQELEKSLVLDLAQLQLPLADKDEVDHSNFKNQSKISSDECETVAHAEPLEEYVKRKIVKDLDKYISNLLDEILNDTIRAIAQADNPFDQKRRETKTTRMKSSTFGLNFALDNSNERNKIDEANTKDKTQLESNEQNNGYINRGFIGSTSDPDALDFHLRHRLNADAILENADCTDSGINSVETIELQLEQEQNLEQSLIDIIDAKLGGTSIGKSLEDLGMEIDGTADARTAKARRTTALELLPNEISECANAAVTEIKKTTAEEKKMTIKDTANLPTPRSSKPFDDVIDEPTFNDLRLEFHKEGTSSNGHEEKPSSNVTSKVNNTMFVIRQRIATRLANSRRKATNNNNNNNNDASYKASKTNCQNSRTSSYNINSSNSINSSSSSSSSINSSSITGASSKTTPRATLELEDYRRRFPVPEANRQHHPKCNEVHGAGECADEVTLRNHNCKPMIVFLHGFGSSAEAFEHQLRYFANLGYPCIAPDLLGHGLSSAPSRPRDYHFDKLLKDLEAVLVHYAFKPGQKCVVVAHNYGCSFATALACKYTSNVHQLVLISGGGPTPLAPPLSEGPGHCCLRASLAPLLICGMQRAVLYSARGRQHPYCGSELLHEQWPSHMRHIQKGMSWPEGDYVFHRRISTPSLLVHGLRDDKVSLVQECQMERTMIKAFLEAIPTAGHMPMTDCPEQLNHMIHCFIDLWKNKKW